MKNTTFPHESMDTTLKGHGLERRGEAVIEKMNGMSDSVSSFTLPGVGMSRENVKMKDGQLFATRSSAKSQADAIINSELGRGPHLTTYTTDSYFGEEKLLHITTCKSV